MGVFNEHGKNVYCGFFQHIFENFFLFQTQKNVFSVRVKFMKKFKEPLVPRYLYRVPTGKSKQRALLMSEGEESKQADY